MEAALGSQRALSLMSSFFAGLALFLSGLGLYGLLSSSVVQRTNEIGIRMALGAERDRVLRMILSEALALLAAGLVLGVIVLTVTVRFVEKLLYGLMFVYEPCGQLEKWLGWQLRPKWKLPETVHGFSN